MALRWAQALIRRFVRAPQAVAGRGFLTRLRTDVRGNTLAIGAAALVPLAGMVGGGIDLSRLYLAKTRMQHACDAGALAGRKAMGSGTWSQATYMPRGVAERAYDANFPSNSYGGTGVSRAFTENAGTVRGTASITLPMTLMRVLGKTTETLDVQCEAAMRLPNTDVMFVLDTTGSMGDTPAGDTKNKIASLKEAVKCFYEIVARLDTDANCTTGTPSGGTGTQVQIRFGFVPYATNVNVGKLLKPEWFADSARYQTREYTRTGWNNGTPTVTGSRLVNPNPQGWTYSGTQWGNISNSDCNLKAVPPNSAFTGQNNEGPNVEYSTTGTYGAQSNTWYWATYQYGWLYEYRRTYDSGSRTCRIEQRQVFGDLRRQYERVDNAAYSWKYGALPVNIGLLKNGASWNNSFQWPIGAQGANRTINWGGCVEERDTVSQGSYSPIPTGAKDLDLDSVPTPGDASTQWKMVLPDLIYTRATDNWYNWTTNEITTTADMRSDEYYACPREAKKLQAWPDPDDFDDYVDGLSPEGNTYHDIGLIWGGRLLSPTGLFKAENALTPKGGEIERHMIFMTDGDTCTAPDNYTAYGVNWFDRRTVGSSTTPSGGCTSTGNLTQQVNARTEALCEAVKNSKITLWVITFGTLDPSTEARMQRCASSGRYFSAKNGPQLQATFKSIADQISMLRLTS